MPPQVNSRHQHTKAVPDTNNILRLTDRTPFLYQELEDNDIHEVAEGDTLHTLSARYYAALGELPILSAAQFWWVIADFQPEPIHDPTLRLKVGTRLFIPSVDTLTSRILVAPVEP